MQLTAAVVAVCPILHVEERAAEREASSPSARVASEETDAVNVPSTPVARVTSFATLTAMLASTASARVRSVVTDDVRMISAPVALVTSLLVAVTAAATDTPKDASTAVALNTSVPRLCHHSSGALNIDGAGNRELNRSCAIHFVGHADSNTGLHSLCTCLLHE